MSYTEPRFRKGVGRLTASVLNNVVQAGRDAVAALPQTSGAQILIKTPSRLVDTFEAEILLATETGVGSKIWLYDFREVIWSPLDNAYIPIDVGIGGITGSVVTGNAARNTNERGLVEGFYSPGYDEANLRGTFELRAIRGRPVVDMRVRRAADSQGHYFFTLGNVIDGVC